MVDDNETDLDYLNFSGVAETVAELIVQASARRFLSALWVHGASVSHR